MDKKSISALVVAFSIAASSSAVISTAAAQTGKASGPAAMSEQQFAKCAATYNFLLRVIQIGYRGGRLQKSLHDEMFTRFVANRALLGANYFSQKNASSAARINLMIQKEENVISSRVANGTATGQIITSEGDACYYKFIRRP